jgi:hypothetical protein
MTYSLEKAALPQRRLEMQRLMVWVFIVIGLGAMVLYAANFWDTKKYTEWTDKEVQRMLEASPWARPVDISLGAGGGGVRGPSATGVHSGGGSSERTIDRGGSARIGTGTASGARMMRIHIRFVSAVPIRQAIARLRFGLEAATSPKALKWINPEAQDYVVNVSGLPMRMLGGNPEQLREQAWLKIKRVDPIAARNVESRRQEGQAELHIFFPKSSHEITAADKNVEFHLRLPRMDVKRKFKLKDMVYNGKLAI